MKHIFFRIIIVCCFCLPFLAPGCWIVFLLRGWFWDSCVFIGFDKETIDTFSKSLGNSTIRIEYAFIKKDLWQSFEAMLLPNSVHFRHFQALRIITLAVYCAQTRKRSLEFVLVSQLRQQFSFLMVPWHAMLKSVIDKKCWILRAPFSASGDKFSNRTTCHFSFWRTKHFLRLIVHWNCCA